MASINTRLNITKLDGNIVQKHRSSKQVGFKQLGPGVETGVHGVHDEKRVWFEVELQGAQGDRKAEVFQVSNDDTAVAQRRLEDKQPEEKTNMDCLSGLSKVLWAEDTTMSTYLVNKEDLTFEVKPHGNVDHVLGSHEVQTQNLIYYHLARDREQYLAWELFGYREDSNEAAFTVAAVEKIYAHESLTFNDTVACESRIHNEKLVQTLLKGHSILSLEGSLSGDCDVEKNGKWSCIYAVGSQEYQMVCTRLDIASADVGMLDKFDRGLQTDVQVFVDFDYAMAAYMTLTGAWKKEIWLKGLLAESGYELSLVAGIATGALVKGGSRSEVPAQGTRGRARVLSHRLSTELRQAVRMRDRYIDEHKMSYSCDDILESVDIMRRMQLDDMEKASRLLLMARETQLKMHEKSMFVVKLRGRVVV
ncbi:hypothetical protein Tco_1338750 [Tanacetum coccineum]